MFKTLLGWLTGGVLDRAMSSVDKWIDSETDKAKIRGEIALEYVRNNASWMRAGGFWTLFLAGLPFVFHAGAVAVYSVLWHSSGPYPQTWDIAALPPPYDEHQHWALAAWFGGLAFLGRK